MGQASRLRLVLLRDPAPIGELFLVNLEVDLGHPCLQPALNIGYGLVVDTRSDFFEEVAEQAGGCNVANPLFHVLLEVTLD